MTAPLFRASFLRPGEITVDSFAGAGGASTGIEAALGRPIDIAINHSAAAIAAHAANHPHTRHYQEDIYKVDPVAACAGRRVGLAWFSPTCTHFSRAKGAGLLDRKIRGLAWVVTRWAKAVRPRVIFLENVTEFATWGPIDASGRPVARKLGRTYRAWLSKLRSYGYEIETRELVAADYGAPTTRRRLFLIARCDGQPIIWPDATHGKGHALPWQPASNAIDWSIPCPSIFGRKKQLAEATLKRIAVGTQRYVVQTGQPFIVRHGHYSTITGAGLRDGCGAGTFRGQPITQPLATICATNDKHLVMAFITKHYGGVIGHDVHRPLGTVTAQDHHALSTCRLQLASANDTDRSEEVRALLARYTGTPDAPSAQLTLIGSEPRDDRGLGLVTLHGEVYRIVDIGTRMLRPRELFNAHDFPRDYIIDPIFNGKPLTQTAQIRLAGNSVVPCLAQALVSVNGAAMEIAS